MSCKHTGTCITYIPLVPCDRFLSKRETARSLSIASFLPTASPQNLKESASFLVYSPDLVNVHQHSCYAEDY